MPLDAAAPPVDHLDVLIVGAGLSGIGAACVLQQECPGKRYAILEARDRSGGTWDLFRYPGIRSDSDMYTLGYSFRPWTAAKSIADGPAILDYVRQTAKDYGVEARIRYRHRVVRADWSSADARWTVEAERDGQIVRISCKFLYMCSGYYNYESGYAPTFAGREDFRGRIVHPQQWSDDIDYAGKKVVIIGSGATAVTLVPTLAQTAAHVTMLQRSPTYILSLPARDKIANALRRIAPARMAYGITRWKNVLMGMFFFHLCRTRPELVKKMVRKGVRIGLGRNAQIGPHFTPSYKPWDQRMCLVPDGDLFKALRSGKASIVTDHIERITPNGIQLKSGTHLDADLIVTATGLQLQLLGGATLSIDGEPVDPSKTLSYKGMMCSGVPNLAFAIGYTNASWTLKCDLTSLYVCRLLKHMDKHGYRQCMPRNLDPDMPELPLIDFSSGYVQRAIDQLPKQGARTPWRLHQNYVKDLLLLKYRSVVDEGMEFSAR
ncbi:MAG TPA: NAD(P)/FAD-dependent oxidoreductase [Fontimonas sp.]